MVKFENFKEVVFKQVKEFSPDITIEEFNDFIEEALRERFFKDVFVNFICQKKTEKKAITIRQKPILSANGKPIEGIGIIEFSR